jgi:hypothetical protein
MFKVVRAYYGIINIPGFSSVVCGVRFGLRAGVSVWSPSRLGYRGRKVRKMLRYAVPPGYQRQQPVKRSEAGAVAGRDRRDSGRGQAAASQATAHGEADLRAAAG